MKISQGFTLIEMLIIVAIVAILVTVAYPSYQASISQSRRADAQSALMGFAQAMERHYTNNGDYLGAATSGADTGSPTIFSTTAPIDGSAVYYNLSIQSAAVNTYILTADPVNAQNGDGLLSLSSTGAKGWDSDDSGTVDGDEAYW